MAKTVLKNTPIHCVVAVSGNSATETIDLDVDILYGTVKTFDATNAAVVVLASNSIVLTSHGLSTGDRVVYSHGGGAVITGLTHEATYFVVVVDSNTIKLATSFANATAATPVVVELTGLGTGTTHKLYKGQYGSSPVVNITSVTWAVGSYNETATITRNSVVTWTLSGSDDLQFNGWTDNRENASDIVVVTPASGATVIVELTKVSGYSDAQHLNQNVN